MGAVWEFVKRHKGKIIIGGVALGGAVAYLQTMSRHKSQSEPQTNGVKLQARRHYVFDSNQRSCDESIIELVPGIKQLVEARFNVEALTEELQMNPQLNTEEKVDRWNKIKIATISRLVGLAYAYSLLTVALKAQISILAAEICAQFDQPTTSSDWTSYFPTSVASFLKSSTNSPSLNHSLKGNVDVTSRQTFLKCIQYFTTNGIQQLMIFVERAVDNEVQNISLKDKFGREEIRALIDSVERRLRSGEPRHLSRLIAHFDEQQAANGDPLNGLLQRLVYAIDSRKCNETMTALVDYYISAACGRISVPAGPLARQLPPLADAFHAVGSTSYDSPLKNSLCSSDVHQFAIEVFNMPRF